MLCGLTSSCLRSCTLGTPFLAHNGLVHRACALQMYGKMHASECCSLASYQPAFKLCVCVMCTLLLQLFRAPYGDGFVTDIPQPPTPAVRRLWEVARQRHVHIAW